MNKNMDPTLDVDECVLNLSLGSLDIGSQAYSKMTSFLSMVRPPNHVSYS